MNRLRPDSPVDWASDDVLYSDEEPDVARDVPPLTWGHDWAAANDDESGAAAPSQRKQRQAGVSRKRGLEPHDP